MSFFVEDMECSHGLIVLTRDGKVVHRCLYSKEPSDQINNLREELRYDSDFGLGSIIDDLIIRPMTEEEFKETERIFVEEIYEQP